MSESPEQSAVPQRLLFVGDAGDSTAARFIEACRSSGWIVDEAPDVYSAMARLANGGGAAWARAVVDARILHPSERGFLDLAPRYFRGLAVSALDEFVAPRDMPRTGEAQPSSAVSAGLAERPALRIAHPPTSESDSAPASVRSGELHRDRGGRVLVSADDAPRETAAPPAEPAAPPYRADPIYRPKPAVAEFGAARLPEIDAPPGIDPEYGAEAANDELLPLQDVLAEVIDEEAGAPFGDSHWEAPAAPTPLGPSLTDRDESAVERAAGDLGKSNAARGFEFAAEGDDPSARDDYSAAPPELAPPTLSLHEAVRRRMQQTRGVNDAGLPRPVRRRPPEPFAADLQPGGCDPPRADGEPPTASRRIVTKEELEALLAPQPDPTAADHS